MQNFKFVEIETIEMPSHASSPLRADDFEVSSRRISPGQQTAWGTRKLTPEGGTSIIKGPGAQTLRRPVMKAPNCPAYSRR